MGDTVTAGTSIDFSVLSCPAAASCRRWFEKQDALKTRRGNELPDFYNITLERPKDDPGGFDMLFVDAAPAGSLGSRLSHSCTPNCQAVILAAAGGRLTVAIFTLRWIAPGEELTFDYSSVTESDTEYRAAVCLCGTRGCRGSFLHWAGSPVYQKARTVDAPFPLPLVCRACFVCVSRPSLSSFCSETPRARFHGKTR